ncbi:MAG: excinuclease ABC subunit UvrC, partial [Candidatus Eisenbacteria bacterium]|nr:excinuclease ABC subunit UvrC [Candidatus Eisenbacteria bacterium]
KRQPERQPERQPKWRQALERKLALLPDAPGVYLLRGRGGRLLYVGKAKRLPPRVRSYFRGPATGDPRRDALRGLVRDLDYIVAASETEALLLEANLVRAHAPRFNVELKDDKRYPYLRLDAAHPFPRLEVVRRAPPDGARYFGPFVHAGDLRRLLRSLRRIFPLRSCADRRLARGGRECLYHHIGLCRAPCTGRIEEAAYRRLVEDLTAFLEGRGEALLSHWRGEMERSAEGLRFEEAARLRDDIGRLRSLMEAQRVVDPRRPDLDAVALVGRGPRAALAVFSHRGGAVVGAWRIAVRRAREAAPAEIMEAALTRHYQERERVPSLILVNHPPRNREILEAWLGERAGGGARIRAARSGPRARLLQAAADNARLWLEELELAGRGRRKRSGEAVQALHSALRLPVAPRRIEGYDVSHLQGGHAVGSLVTFVDGRPLKSGYRHFRIRAAPAADDFAALAEVLGRRLARLREEGEEAPDLILIDGGRGQAARAAAVLAGQGRGDLPLAALAKRAEEIFLPGEREALRLPRASPGLQLLQRVRDEAHRFAVGYHRRLRSRFLDESPLEKIPGLGPARSRALLEHFGGLSALRAAGRDRIMAVPGIGPGLAGRIEEALRGGGEDG